jgi:hypothetical protein
MTVVMMNMMMMMMMMMMVLVVKMMVKGLLPRDPCLAHARGRKPRLGGGVGRRGVVLHRRRRVDAGGVEQNMVLSGSCFPPGAGMYRSVIKR